MTALTPVGAGGAAERAPSVAAGQPPAAGPSVIGALVVSVEAIAALQASLREIVLRSVRVDVHALELSAAGSRALGAAGAGGASVPSDLGGSAAAGAGGGKESAGAGALYRVDVDFPADSMASLLSTKPVSFTAPAAAGAGASGASRSAQFGFSGRVILSPAHAEGLREALTSGKEGESDLLFSLVRIDGERAASARGGGGGGARKEVKVAEAFVDLAQLRADGKDVRSVRIELAPVDAKGRVADGEPPLGELTVSVEAAAALRALML